MKMEGEIISKEIIKPSTPTPHDLKIHNLSLLDQIVPPFFAPMVFYYPNLVNTPNYRKTPESNYQTTQILKQSLSETLTRFYPLAGRIKDELSIDCNDQGVLFVVAKFRRNLSDFLKKPDINVDRAHIPGQLTWDEPGPGSRVAMVQANYYDCGGVVMGFMFYHKLADGLSAAAFMKDWAANTRGRAALLEAGPDAVPSFNFHSLFPNKPAMRRESHLFTVMKPYFKIGKPVIRRYVFDAKAISALRAQLMSGHGGPIKQGRPTRVEIVTALIWKCFMVACAAVNKDTDSAVSLLSHVVSMRKKAEPQFPDNSFGNFVWLGPATSPNNGLERDFGNLWGKVRSAIRKIDHDFVKRMEGEDGYSGYCKNVEGSWKEFPEKADYLAVSSWCNFGLYDVDFGWGKPVWVTKCDAESDTEWAFLNVLWLMDTREGDGIEAWLNLDDKYSEAFDEIQELRDLAKISPSPLDMAGTN